MTVPKLHADLASLDMERFRVCGRTGHPMHHLLFNSQYYRWVRDTGYIPAMLCGDAFRPSYVGVTILDGDALCSFCKLMGQRGTVAGRLRSRFSNIKD